MDTTLKELLDKPVVFDRSADFKKQTDDWSQLLRLSRVARYSKSSESSADVSGSLYYEKILKILEKYESDMAQYFEEILKDGDHLVLQYDVKYISSCRMSLKYVKAYRSLIFFANTSRFLLIGELAINPALRENAKLLNIRCLIEYRKLYGELPYNWRKKEKKNDCGYVST